MADIQTRLQALGLRVVSYTSLTTSPGEDGRTFWIPRDCVGWDGRAGITHRIREGDRRDVPYGTTYSTDGWEPWADAGMGAYGQVQLHGGRHETFESALAWLENYAAHRLEQEWAR